MEAGLKWLDKEVDDIKLKMKFLEAAEEDLHTKQLYAEAYSRRENLKFFGLAEKETKGDSEVSEVINTRDLLLSLGFEEPEKKKEKKRNLKRNLNCREYIVWENPLLEKHDRL